MKSHYLIYTALSFLAICAWTLNPVFASTITTINGTDTISSSRTVINTNFSNLNTDKLQSGNYATTLGIGSLTVGQTASSTFATDGKLTTPGLTITGLSGVLIATAGLVGVGVNGTNYSLITANTCGVGSHFSGVTAAGAFTCSSDTGPFSYPFPGNATSTAIAFNNGATTTDFYVSNRLGVGTTTPGAILSVNGAWNSSAPLFMVGTTTLTASTTVFQINNNGKTVGSDIVNSFTGVLSPTRSFSLGTGTTTSWTASTTGSAYSPYLLMPFAGMLKQVRCGTDASFLGVNVQVNGSNATPSYFVASTTIGVEKFTAGNTFTAGQKVLANFGTTTTATATQINCTFDVTEAP